MLNKNNKKALAAKVIGGIAFMFVFILNMTVFVQKNDSTGDLSFVATKAYANGEGTNKDHISDIDPCTFEEEYQVGCCGYYFTASRTVDGNLTECHSSKDQTCTPAGCAR